MDWLGSQVEWAKSREVLLWWLFAASVAMFLATPVVVAWLVVRLPTDYFTAQRRQPPASWQRYRVLRPLVLVAKNLAGIVLLAAGLVMLIVPGQGLLTMAVGLMLVDFPGKYRVERWLATRRPVWRSIDWLRNRTGRDSLQRPE
jgi:hypothetical protein